MKEIRYTITFHSEWHCGSGMSSGSDLDQLVIKDAAGFPVIPGKTLKGLLKEAAEEMLRLEGKAPEEDPFITEFFGYFDEEKHDKSTVHTRGKAFFSDATLSSYLKQKAGNELSRFFYRDRASTAIAEDGVARKGSLRRIQTTIPAVLEACIYKVDESYIPALSMCMQWVKRLGQNRNRGLGRCTFQIIEEKEAGV